MKTYQLLARGLALSALMVFAAACQKVATVSVTPASLKFEKAGQTGQLTAAETDKDGQPMKKPLPIAWTSDKPEVASVDANGNVAAHKTGTATITAAAEQVKGTASVEVHIPAKIVAEDVNLVGVGQSQPFAPVVVDEAGKAMPQLTKDIQLKVENPAIASLVADPKAPGQNLVTAGAAGETRITATFGELKQDFKVTVKLPDFTDLKVEKPTLDLKVDGTDKITATPMAADKPVPGVPVTFTSSDEKVATVDQTGTVTAKGPGKAEIAVKAGEKTVTVPVTVKK